jgi:hypothetical protein
MPERTKGVNDVTGSRGAAAGNEDPRLTVRVIGRCTFRCQACSTFSSPERKGLLSPEDFGCVVGILAENDFSGTLHLSGGEPTLHPALSDMISLASRTLLSSRVVVFTNGEWVGSLGWRARLKSLFAGPNVLVRFSLDKQHVEGRARALLGAPTPESLAASEGDLFDKARSFLTACMEEGARPGANFDLAFKGTAAEGKAYLAPLGDVPVYPILFIKDPARRPKQVGVMAVDLDKDGRALVYPTLGHIPAGEALGGLDTLPEALRMNREAPAAIG